MPSRGEFISNAFKRERFLKIRFSNDLQNRVETAEAVRLLQTVARVVGRARSADEFITIFAGGTILIFADSKIIDIQRNKFRRSGDLLFIKQRGEVCLNFTAIV